MTGKSLLTFFRRYYSVIILFFSILIYRINVLFSFGFKYTDADQTIMWLATKDYAHGEFHEPFFYGQGYNVMLESLLAVPFHWLNLSLNIALPIITTLLTLLPFTILAFLAIKKEHLLSSLIILSIPLCLPIEYDLHTSISRGFVTGLAVFSISFLFIKDVEVTKNRKYGVVLFLAVLAYIVNPNSILLSIPVLFYLFLLNITSPSFYKKSIIGFIIGLLVLVLFKLFYQINSNFALHGYEMNFALEFFIIGIKNVDEFFRMVTPIFWKQGFLNLIFPVLFSIYFFKKKKREIAIVSIILPLLYLLTMFVSKVHDGNDSVFFHLSRMYLALPIVLSYLIYSLELGKSKFQHFILIVPLGILMIKTTNLEKSIASNLNRNHIVTVTKTKKLFKECKDLADYSKSNKIELIIFHNITESELFNYGCAACEPDFPKTLYPKYERRTWRLLEDKNKVYKRILVFDNSRDLSIEFENVQKVNVLEGMYLITNNQEPTISLINKLKIPIREF